jgi:aminopeptidase C
VNGGKLELQGKDTADYKIHLTNTVGTDVVYYINLKTYLLDKSDVTASANGQTVNITMHYGDYRKTDAGLLVAYSWVQDLPQMSLTFTTKSVDINKPIDPAFFDMPKN